jgi:steroid delta-isomerase-like uncharacterized protein
MSEQENIRIVKQTFDTLNSHNVELSDQTTSRDLRVYTIDSNTEMNRDEFRNYLRNLMTAFPDLRMTPKDIVAQGNKVAVSWISKGTHKAPFTLPFGGPQIPATNRPVTLQGCFFFELQNNTISRIEGYWDRTSLLTQMGLVNEQELNKSRR